MFPDSYLHDSLKVTFAKQHAEEIRQAVARHRLAIKVAEPEQARRRFFRMYRLRSVLFRLMPRLAARLAR